jgi:hypothetical protein
MTKATQFTLLMTYAMVRSQITDVLQSAAGSQLCMRSTTAAGAVRSPLLPCSIICTMCYVGVWGVAAGCPGAAGARTGGARLGRWRGGGEQTGRAGVGWMAGGWTGRDRAVRWDRGHATCTAHCRLDGERTERAICPYWSAGAVIHMWGCQHIT